MHFYNFLYIRAVIFVDTVPNTCQYYFPISNLDFFLINFFFLIQFKVDCKICLEGSVEMVFIPCGHICACNSCAERVTSCPLCRKTIEQSIKIYVS